MVTIKEDLEMHLVTESANLHVYSRYFYIDKYTELSYWNFRIWRQFEF